MYICICMYNCLHKTLVLIIMLSNNLNVSHQALNTVSVS